MILYGINYSAWSLRAKWALQHHGVKFEYREYLSMVTTPRVRWAIRDFTGPISVPILIDGDLVLRESLDIARHAEAVGSGAPLFDESEEVIDAWTATADQIAEAGRALTTFEVIGDRNAVLENVPPIIPTPLRGLAKPLVALGARHLASKYEFSISDRSAYETTMRASLERVANRLVEADSLGESFGWPDIAVVSALQFLRPSPNWVHLGPHSRECWTRPALSDEFSDLLDWRERVLSEHLP